MGAHRTPTLHSVFDARLNGLNALRLALALSVIVWHSFPLTGNDVEFAPLRQAFSELGVDGFFAISGYLIVSSWKRNPQPGRYMLARVLRIFPAFWVCLVITAVAIAPLATMLAAGQSYTQVMSGQNVTYVLSNLGLYIFQPGIGATPTGVPFTEAWNGSLWTLFWEFLCYLGVLALGLAGLYRFRATVPLVFVALLALLAITAYGPIDNTYVVNIARFGIMFAAGMLIEQYGRRIPMTWALLAAAAAVTVLTLFLPDYRIFGALPWAYLVIGIGAMVKVPRLKLENDISYGTYIYAFPLQQLLASAGAIALGVPAFAALSILATLLPATLSWFMIERPALNLRPKRRNDVNVQTEAVTG